MTRRGDGSVRRWETRRQRKGARSRRSGLASGKGEGEVALRGIVKIKNRRKRTRRRNGESPRAGGEQSLGRAD